MKDSKLAIFTMFLKSQSADAFRKGLRSPLLRHSHYLLSDTCHFAQTSCLSSLHSHMSQCVIFQGTGHTRGSANLLNSQRPINTDRCPQSPSCG